MPLNIFKKRTFLEKIGTEEESEEEEEEEEEEDYEDSQVPEKKKKRKLKVEKNPSKFYFPTFLSRTSSTYFKTVNASFLQKITKNQKKKTSNKKKNAKMASNSSFNLIFYFLN